MMVKKSPRGIRMSLMLSLAEVDGSSRIGMVHSPVSISERREWVRLPISIPFFVRGRESSGEEFTEFATALNVSEGGVLLAMRRYLEPGNEVLLEIPILLINKAQLPRSVFLLRATVLRCSRVLWYFLSGLQFEEPLGGGTDLSQESQFTLLTLK